jgi:hypothetical protein
VPENIPRLNVEKARHSAGLFFAQTDDDCGVDIHRAEKKVASNKRREKLLLTAG